MMLTSNKVVQNMRLSRISCVTSLNERTKKLGVGEMKLIKTHI